MLQILCLFSYYSLSPISGQGHSTRRRKWLPGTADGNLPYKSASPEHWPWSPSDWIKAITPNLGLRLLFLISTLLFSLLHLHLHPFIKNDSPIIASFALTSFGRSVNLVYLLGWDPDTATNRVDYTNWCFVKERSIEFCIYLNSITWHQHPHRGRHVLTFHRWPYDRRRSWLVLYVDPFQLQAVPFMPKMYSKSSPFSTHS